MNKKYIMFVNESGFFNKDNTFSIVGVVFEHDYCTNLGNKECELASKVDYFKERRLGNSNLNVCIDDVIFEGNNYINIDIDKIKEFVNHIPMLFKGIKCNIILSSIKNSDKSIENSYNKVANNLLKNFYSFLIKNKASSGCVVLESPKDKGKCMVQQKFFDIYNEQRNNLIVTKGSQEKINSFIIWNKNDTKYGFGIQVANIINNVIYRVSNGLTEFDNKIVSYVEYGSENKIFKTIENKIYKDNLTDKSNTDIEKDSDVINLFINQVKNLKQELELKNIKIDDKEKEINKLTQEMQRLQQRLADAMKNRKSDNMLLEILSDIDIKVKGLGLSAKTVKN